MSKGLRHPDNLSAFGYLAGRDVDLAHARDWSRERMARQRKLNDAQAQEDAAANWKGAEAREWDGKPGKSRGDTFREDLEKAILKPQLLAASLPLAASVPTSVAGKVIGGGLGAALGGIAGEDPYISALSVLHPALAAAQLGHMMYRDGEFAPMREAEAAPLQKLLQMVYRGRAGDAPSTVFASPQRKVAEYYAAKRAAQTGNPPRVDSLLVDPFAGRQYGHSIPMDRFNRDVMTTQARELRPEDVVETYAKGGLARVAARMGKDAAPARKGVSDVIKEKGGNWLTGSVEGALGGLKRQGASTPEEAATILGGQGFVTPEVLAAVQKNRALNSFVDKQLTRYVKNDMATPEDPIRALAERGVLHFDPRGIRDRAPIMDQVVARRLMSGNPATERAVTPLGEQWERYADAAIRPMDISEMTAGQRGANQWVEKVPANTQIHQIDYKQLGGPMAGEGLGFSHLIDELSNALNPESGLPRHLLLDPKSMERVSVPQAVERVAEINKWRAAQKAEADMLRANNAATVLHKEYPDKGFKWVELKKPNVMGNPETTDANFKDSLIQAQQQLQDALKYEGDTMGHCVGGYCEDVASGRSRIYSLRDAKGQPHVTVEVRPDSNWKIELYKASLRGDAIDEMFGERAPEIRAAFNASLNASPYNTIQRFLEENQQYLPAPNRIVQIKGKQNKAPNKEYLPFVQDFVRSGKWSDVGDLQNSGLLKHSSGYLTKDELGKLVDEGDMEAMRIWQHSYIDR